jgi:ferredoxin
MTLGGFMGHIVGKNVFRDLGHKIDTLNVKVPWNETFHAILQELYSLAEADLVVRMPASLSTIEEIEAATRLEPRHLGKLLDGLCNKGLVVDVFLNNNYYYTPSPLIIGIFEFTMMRTDDLLDIKKIAGLFHRYMSDETFYAANFKSRRGGKAMGLMRTLPYEESFSAEELAGDFVEVLDYEKATAIVEAADRFSLSLCSCRHEKMHAREGENSCRVPLETCSSFGYSADYLIRHNLAKEISKSEMLENVARSKELGLVLNADNVKNNCQFICHCCKCCCNVLLGISRFGYSNIIVTSSFIAGLQEEKCVGCGKCVGACGIEAIKTVPCKPPAPPKKRQTIKIDRSLCLGCGACVVKCPQKALHLLKRKKRVLHPETTFEKAILKYLERGTLQEQLFTDPKRIGQKAMRALLGGFLRLPAVKRALMSDILRSSFLQLLKKGARLQGKGWLIDL